MRQLGLLMAFGQMSDIVLVGAGGFEVGVGVGGGLVPIELHADNKSKHVSKVGMSRFTAESPLLDRERFLLSCAFSVNGVRFSGIVGTLSLT